MCEESVGDAGTCSLGYFGGAWAPDGAGLLAHGFTGALHLWRRAGAANFATCVTVMMQPGHG